MKPYMLIILVISLLFGLEKSKYRLEPNQTSFSDLELVDSIIIKEESTLGNSIIFRTIVILDDSCRISEFISFFKFKKSPYTDKDALIGSCMCGFGNFQFELYEKDSIITSITYHHDNHIRIDQLEERDLKPSSIRKLRIFLEELSDSKKIMKLKKADL